MHLGRSKVNRDGWRRNHHSQPKRTTWNHYLPTIHRRPISMSNHGPGRIPVHFGWGGTCQQQGYTDGEVQITTPPSGHICIHHVHIIGDHFHRKFPIYVRASSHRIRGRMVTKAPREIPTDPPQSSVLTPSWELDPLPLITHHPPRITDSNTRITLREDSLKESWPTNENGISWIQIQQALWWKEHIQGSSVITHEDLSTLTHPNRGWTIVSGTLKALRETWGLTLETLQKIYDSCITQRQQEKRTVTENLRLLHNPKTNREDPHFHPYETYPPVDQTDLEYW